MGRARSSPPSASPTPWAGGFELWLKREDLLPLAFGGNKLRNLEFLLGEALGEGADVLVTSGRRWSNHCRLTAAAGARAGLDVQLVLSGPPAPGGESANGRIARLLGATVHQLETADRAAREAREAEVVAELRAAGRRPYRIPVGGRRRSVRRGRCWRRSSWSRSSRRSAGHPTC